MLSNPRRERLTEIAKAFDEDEVRCILKVFKSQYLVEELDRRNRIIYEQYNGIVNEIEKVNDNTSYEELCNILRSCKKLLTGGRNGE